MAKVSIIIPRVERAHPCILKRAWPLPHALSVPPTVTSHKTGRIGWWFLGLQPMLTSALPERDHHALFKGGCLVLSRHTTYARTLRPQQGVLAVFLLTLVAFLAFAQPGLADEPVQLQFELPTSRILTYRVNSQLFPIPSLDAAPEGPAMLEWSMVFNMKIEPLDAKGEHPFAYWFDSFHITILGLPFDHLVGPERWEGTFAPTGELLGAERHPILDELGLDMELFLADFFVQPPPTPVAIGDTWHVTYQLERDATLNHVSIAETYTLVDYDPEAATAELSEETQGNYEAVVEFSPGVVGTTQGELSGVSSSTVDLRTGQRLQLTSTGYEVANMRIPLTAGGSEDAQETYMEETSYFVSETTLEWVPPAN